MWTFCVVLQLILVLYYGHVDADSTLYNFLQQSISVDLFFINGVCVCVWGRGNADSAFSM